VERKTAWETRPDPNALYGIRSTTGGPKHLKGRRIIRREGEGGVKVGLVVKKNEGYWEQHDAPRVSNYAWTNEKA